MTALRVLVSRVLGLFTHRHRDEDLAEDIQAHLDLLTEEYVRRGLPRDEARAAARRAFGGVEQVKEAYRDQRRLPFFDSVGQDTRFAARLLVKDWGFTLVAVIALALGIGANNTVFTILNALTRGLPVERPDRIVRLTSRDVAGRELRVSYRDFQDWRAATQTCIGVAAFAQIAMTISEPDRATERFSGAHLSANAFELLGEQPTLGRNFLFEDDQAGARPVVILGYRVWQNRYSGDPEVIGRTVAINGVTSDIVGVMREGFRFPVVADIWQPLSRLPDVGNQTRDARRLEVFGRLSDDAALNEAQQELDSIAARLADEYPDTNRDIRATVSPFLNRGFRYPVFLALMASVAFVLLIACANIANLLLVRATHRAREVGIRVSLGATRWRIVRQLLVENAFVVVLAGPLGFGLSLLGLRAFAREVEGINFPYHIQWTMDGYVFTFFAAACLGTGLAFGLLPVLHVSKTQISEVLKQGGRTATDSLRTRRWTSVLLTAELGFTLALLAGAGLMMRSLLALHRADLIAETSNVLAMGLSLTTEKYSTAAQRTMFYENLETRLAGIPAVASATLASSVPFAPTGERELSIDGRIENQGEKRPTVTYVTIGSRYFETLGLRLVRGRDFTATDGTPGHESAIVNQRFVAMYFEHEDPIGRRIRVTDANAPSANSPWVSIVGVSPSLRQQQAAELRELDPVVYLPSRAEPRPSATLLVRTHSDSGSLTSLLRDELRAIDPDVPVSGIIPLERLMIQSRWGHRVFGTMLAVFGAIALLLSAIGLYALTAYTVKQRTQEIGIRMALGARAQQVVWLFLRQTLVPLSVGLAIGGCGALVIASLLSAFLMQTEPTDPLTWLSGAALLIVVAIAAAFFPARRAARLDPVVVLRHE